MHTLLTQASYHYAFPAWPPFIVGFSILALSIIIAFRERFSQISTAYMTLSMSLAAWLFGCGLMYSSVNAGIAMQWARLEHVAIAFIPAGLLYFTLILTKRHLRYIAVIRMAYAISLFFACTGLFTDHLVSGLTKFEWGLYPQFGVIGGFFLAYFLSIMLASLWLIWKAYHRFQAGMQQAQLKSFFGSFIIAMLACIDFLACYGINVYPVGFLPVYAGLLMVAQTIWRYRFADITPAFAANEILATMPTSLFVLDHRGIICLVNHAACELMGKDEKELIGTPVVELIHSRRLLKSMQLQLHKGTLRNREITISHPTHKRRYVSLSVSVIQDGATEPMAYVALAEDITSRKQTEDKVRLYADIVQNTQIGLVVLQPDDPMDARTLRLVAANPAVTQATGLPIHEFIGRRLSEIVPDFYQTNYPDLFMNIWRQRLTRDIGDINYGDKRVRRGIYALKAFPLPHNSLGISVENVTERRQIETALQVSEKRLERLMNSNIIGFMRVGADERINDANDAFLDMLGYTRDDLAAGRVGGSPMTPVEYRAVDDWMRKRLEEDGVCPAIDKEYIRKNGTRVPVLVGAVRLAENDYEALCFVIDSTDRRAAQEALQRAYDEMEMRVQERTAELQHEVTRRREAEQALRNMVVTDPLTGLYNRRGFLALAEQNAKLAQREKRRLRLYFADLDELKPINDRHGHKEGDNAIIQGGKLLRSVFRASDVVARIGGDEYAMIALEENDSQESDTMRRLEEKVTEFNASSGLPYQVHLSMGSASIDPDTNLQLTQLMDLADQALYENKERRKTERRKSA